MMAVPFGSLGVRFMLLLAAACVLLLQEEAAAADARNEARVTRVVRDVKLLPDAADPKAAAVNDQVREGVAVRTGDQSRSELTFVDLTISRLGANTIFSFNRAGRNVELNSGSILLRVPKDSGGGSMRSPAVSVAVTGTTLILETTRASRNKLMVLEGSARLGLSRNRSQTRDVRAGQMLDVPAGATTLPMPTKIDLNELMKTHPLITGFSPLPSRELIAAAARNQGPGEPVYEGQPVAGPQIGFRPPIPGIQIPPLFPGGQNPGTRNPGTQNPGTGNPNAGNPPRGAGATSQPTPVRTPGRKTPRNPNDPGVR